MNLQVGSPAIDAGSDAACQGTPVLGIDQRGITRPQGSHCDVGAVEANSLTSVGTAPTSGAPSPGAPTSGINPTVVTSSTGTTTGALAFTGTPVLGLTLTALIALTIGAGLTVLARRRRLSNR